MSRTDKTRPFWVKKRDYLILRPRMVEEQKFYEYRTYEWWRGEFRCTCPLCGWDYYSTSKRKRDRIAGKEYCRGGWEREYGV